MNSETWAQIRMLHAIERLPISEIARRLHLDRKTVRRAVRSELASPARASIPKPSKLDSYKDYVRGRLQEFPRITATRLAIELAKIGYSGGLTILRGFLATLRSTQKEAFLRIETQPAEQGQVDWANCGTIRIGAALRKLSAFVMVLSYSRMIYVELTLSQCIEDFLGAHLRAFRFFGGVPKKLVYDNLKSVCLARLGSHVQFNRKFLEFSGACLFEPVLCRPARGNEKGKVESGIHYLRISFLDGREGLPWPQMRLELDDWLRSVANVRIHRTTRLRPADRFEAERGLLTPLPAQEPDVSIVRPVKANSTCRVHFDGNVYSVPAAYASKTLTLRATTFEVRVFDGPKLLATHARSYERGVPVEDPAHVETILAAKRAARAAKSPDSFLALAGPSEPDRALLKAYLEGLLRNDLKVHHHIDQILNLAREHGRTEVLQALHRALEHAAFGAPYVKNIIAQQLRARGLPQATQLRLISKPHLAQVGFEDPDLALYDDLFSSSKEDSHAQDRPTDPRPGQS
mgnify:FL=1